MNIRMFFFTSMVLTIIVSFSNMVSVSAYSLDDFSKEYPNIKIKSETRTNAVGQSITTRWANVLRLVSDGADNTVLWFNIQEINGVKNVEVRALYRGDEWMFYNRLTIGNGFVAKDVYSSYGPFREVDGRHVVEDLYFKIYRTDLETWRFPKSIRICGAKYYDQVGFDSKKYNEAMSIIEKFLALD